MPTLTPSQSDNISFLASYFFDGLKPPPNLTVSQYADKYRILDSKSSPEPGPWRTARAPYTKEIMDELSPRSRAERVVWQKGSQVAGTEVGINWVLSSMDLAPCPMLHAQPTIDLGKRWSKQRFTPAINKCERLYDKVVESKTRDNSNTMLQKDFPGGTIIITGANSAAGLRSMPICNLFADEIDAWPPDVDNEGDPLALALRRITNWTRRKSYLCSTPTIKGMSRIEKEFEASDQRYYYVPCPFCRHEQIITWDKIKFDSDDHDKAPETVRMICEKCHAEIYEHHKTEMLAAGRWKKHNPKSEIPGFHLSALYAPLGWYSWRQAVKEHLEALGDPLKRKVWVNTVLAELWDDAAVTIDHHWLMKRKKTYPAQVPDGSLVLTAGVDTQDDRLEATIFGFGLDYETWIIEHLILPGDPDQDQVWIDLDALLLKEYEHERGFKMRIASMCIDAMGHKTDSVYDYCRPRFARRVFACQGTDGPGRPL
ncbi:MAG: phage terminase large subunit family protein, partial [Candidatus Aminicenantes bacterium]|nr:phage terminase large subunit family protein [Candidatus Aminicenantes bacterium]NIQ72207.1 phage terminase large subunit family protein [Candidatus Aminicenantes bacterium]NIT28243.1 phage terminase large subunit family protein [Candidatus Aminicenantes bacterium]